VFPRRLVGPIEETIPESVVYDRKATFGSFAYLRWVLNLWLGFALRDVAQFQIESGRMINGTARASALTPKNRATLLPYDGARIGRANCE
jgi:hypothetical protein